MTTNDQSNLDVIDSYIDTLRRLAHALQAIDMHSGYAGEARTVLTDVQLEELDRLAQFVATLASGTPPTDCNPDCPFAP